MTITTKFKKDLQTLEGAAKGDFFLDVKNPKLFKKVRKFYENDGVEFSGDPLMTMTFSLIVSLKTLKLSDHDN